MPSRYFIVNVPDFRLEAIEDGKPVLAMRVVVGEPGQQDAHLRRLDDARRVQPVLERAGEHREGRDDSASRARPWSFWTGNNMEVVSASGGVVDPSSVDWSNPGALRIRQRPGSGNALGGCEVHFPEQLRRLSARYRTRPSSSTVSNAGSSHGCVRVEEPHKLAQYVLREQPEWTPGGHRCRHDVGTGKAREARDPHPRLHRLQNGVGT
jgi:murein L,D-transpeptidase YcbB/YkuD